MVKSAANELVPADGMARTIEEKFLVVAPHVQIPLSEFTFSFARSGGPGGQNVNKVNSKAQLRWRVADTPSLQEEVRARFVAQNRRRITVEGDFLISSQRFRDQPRNVADCREKLRWLLEAAMKSPARRRKTKPTAAGRRRRLVNKRRQSAKKQLRRTPESHD